MRTSLIYQVALLLVALVTVLLPLAYLAIVGATGWLVYWHATGNITVLENASGAGGAKLAILLYVGPLIAGVVGVAFMIKPLFAPRIEQPEPYTLSPADEPALFAFVERLCAVLGAPMPKRIDVVCEVNASASFRRGFLSMAGSDLVLTIGAPLVAGLSLQQFTGVLAHEFGHFTQGVAMRAHYIIWRINRWFARVVYERDAWDEKLDEWQEASDFLWITLIVLLVRAFVGLTRGILWILMQLAHGVSCFMSRQMEYDADRRQVNLVGSAVFEPTFRRITELAALWGGVMQEARAAWDRRELPDNLPALMLAIDRDLPTEIRGQIVEAALSQKTGAFDTHPAWRDRVRAAARAEQPGVFALDAPATALFTSFTDICRRASYLHYRGILGEAVMSATFTPTGTVAATRAAERRAVSAHQDFFGGALVPEATIPAPSTPPAAPDDPREALASLKTARADMLRHRPGAAAAAATLRDSDKMRVQSAQATALLEAGFRFMPGSLGLSAATEEAARARAAEVRRIESEATLALAPFAHAAARRLRAALSLLHAPGAQKRIPDAAVRQKRVARLWEAWRATGSAMDAAEKLRAELAIAAALGAHGATQKDKAAALGAVTDAVNAMRRRLSAMRIALGDARDPFDRGAGLLGAFIVSEVSDEAEAPAVFEAAAQAYDRVHEMYHRALGELAEHARVVEAALKLVRMDPSACASNGG